MALFGDKTNRESAKILFLSFCYGMGLPGMARLATEASGKGIAEVTGVMEGFFGKYRRLSVWADELRGLLVSEGRIGTRLGNFRYRDRQGGELLSEEGRWAISQRIQGTASLILKRVILGLSELCPTAEILLPMHDALLMQVPREEVEVAKSEIGGVFLSAYRSACPSVDPRVVFGSFAK